MPEVYIFDFDDNIIFTRSSSYIYHKETDEELTLSSREYVQHRHEVGHKGKYKDYVIDPSPGRSFRRFGDSDVPGESPFLQDLQYSVQQDNWQGPSWTSFVKAVSLDRTIAIATKEPTVEMA